MDMAALMFGRLMGENAAHEVGHFTANAFVPHDAAGFMESGSGRTFLERTGMTQNATAPILSDGGRATINDLSPALLHIFEEFLPVNPPIDQARLRTRGTVGSFALGVRRGWINGAATSYAISNGGPLSYREGWKASAVNAARRAAMNKAVAAGASPAEAESFAASLFT